MNLLLNYICSLAAEGETALIVRQPTIVFDNVTFGYEPGRTILNGLSFEVPAGSTTRRMRRRSTWASRIG